MKPSTVKTHSLSTVYVDNEPVGLLGDPNPLVSKIIVAGGLKPGAVQLSRARSADDSGGTPLALDDTVDRTAQPTTPIYLTSKGTSAVPATTKASRRQGGGAGADKANSTATPTSGGTQSNKSGQPPG